MTTQDISIPIGKSRYYSNCRGVNYLPIMESQWKGSGYLPRYSQTLSVFGIFNPGLAFDTSNSFQGTNKTAIWWYYNTQDNETSLSLLRGLGINAIRVFLDIYVWHRSRTSFLSNLQDFLRLCDKYKIRAQLVLWDGIQINTGAETAPTQRSMTASSVENGLLSQWQANPHHFEVSSHAQALNFFTTCATPYLADICSNVSSYQSLWSFDLLNESSQVGVSTLVSTTSHYISGCLSSLGIGLTVGYGSTYDQFSGTLFGGGNPVWPNLLTLLSGVINFASIHPYVMNSYSVAKDIVNEAVSAYQMTGRPAMFNEGASPDVANWVYTNTKNFTSGLGLGGMTFDGLIDYAVSYEPFRDVQGLLFYDGQARNLSDTNAYMDLAAYHRWLRPHQLHKNITQKDISINNGIDGGYYSGTPPQHAEFLANAYTLTTQAKWQAAKAYVYSVLRTNGSKNYTPFPGHPLQSTDMHSVIASGYNLEDFINISQNYATYFSALSSIPDISTGQAFQNRNFELWLRDKTLYNIATLVFQVVDGLPRNYIIGTKYDRSIVPSGLRLSLSSHLFSSVRSDGSSIDISIDSNLNTATSASYPCLTNNTCLFNTPFNPNSGVNWAAYDTYYGQAFTKLNDCLSYHLSATDPQYRLY